MRFLKHTFSTQRTHSQRLLCCSLIRRDVATMREAKWGGGCNYTLLTKRLFFFLMHHSLCSSLSAVVHVYYHNARSLLTAMWRGEHERQRAAVGLFGSLKTEEGHGNIYQEDLHSRTHSHTHAQQRSHPARPAFELLSWGDVFLHRCIFSSQPLPPEPPTTPHSPPTLAFFFSFFTSPPRTRCAGTPISSLKNQQPLMLDEGKRSCRRRRRRRSGKGWKREVFSP